MENVGVNFFDSSRNLIMHWYDISIKEKNEKIYYSFKLRIRESVFMVETEYEIDISEIYSFILDLEKMCQENSLIIRLNPLGEFFTFEFERERSGRIEAKIFISELSGNIELSYSFDQTFLPLLITELKESIDTTNLR